MNKIELQCAEKNIAASQKDLFDVFMSESNLNDEEKKLAVAVLQTLGGKCSVATAKRIMRYCEKVVEASTISAFEL